MEAESPATEGLTVSVRPLFSASLSVAQVHIITTMMICFSNVCTHHKHILYYYLLFLWYPLTDELASKETPQRNKY